jgi:methyl-accepting chemotaxis protein
MSASVNSYSEKIKEMTGYIEQMEDLTENFRSNLKDYNV